MKDVSLEEFREYLKSESADEFEAVFEGNEFSAPVTGNKYIFLQIITYCGDDDILSSYRTWHSGNEFFLVYKNIRVRLEHYNVRTFIEETGSFSEKDSDSVRLLPSKEYGLIKNKRYYIKISSEEYSLPPERESEKPHVRTNHVLWISSRPFKNGKSQVELTPAYQNWSY